MCKIMDITIRQEQKGDHSAVYGLVESAFRDVPESDHREQYLVERLRYSETFVPQLALVAETGSKEIVAYVMMSEVRIVSEKRNFITLCVAPLAVLLDSRTGE